MTSYTPLRVEIKPSGREKLERAAAALNRSPNDLVNILVDSLEEMDIQQVVTIKLKRDPEIVEPKGPKLKIIRKTSTWSVRP